MQSNPIGLCLKPKVLGGLLLLVGAVALFAPHLLSTVLPALLVAACPLSMLFMALAMRGHAASGKAGNERDPAVVDRTV